MLGATAQVRRFRPGLDYSLAHAGQLGTADGAAGGAAGGAASLEVSYCCVPSRSSGAARAQRAWDSGDVGGFECFVRREDEHQARADRWSRMQPPFPV